MKIERVNVLGVGVSAINMKMATATIMDWIERRDAHYVCITGVHGIMESYYSEELRAIHNRAGLVTPDGMPLVWLSRLAGHRHVRRVYGPDLMMTLSVCGVRQGYRHYYYGGAAGTADRLAARMQQRFPGLQVAGCFAPPFRALNEEEEAKVIEQINAARADILWIGLSTPKQERWMARFAGRIDVPVMVGVGAAFDFHAGLKPQAPRWMQTAGLEWAFRMATEPRRLAGRYLRNNPRFVFRVLQQWLGLTRFPTAW